MYHLLLQHDALRDLPAAHDDARARTEEPAVLSYRSEAFAEDLSATHAAPFERQGVALASGRTTLLFALPLGALLAGALLVFGLA